MNRHNERYSVLTGSPEKSLLEKWDDFLEHSACASHYVTTDFFHDPFVGVGQRFAVLAFDGEQVNAVLTGLMAKGVVTSGLPVRPQIAFRDGVDRVVTARDLVDGINFFAGKGSSLINVHSWEPIGGLDKLGYRHDLSTGGNQVVMLDPAKGPEALFKEFSERRRTEIRKVMKKGVLDVKILETEDELAELYLVHQNWCQRKSIEPDEYQAFCVNLNPKYRTVLIAKYEGKVIAGTYLRYSRGGLVEYAANNSLADFNYLKANELLGWRAVEWVCANGFSHFSIGGSHTFLARFGGDIVPTHRYQLDRTFLRIHANRERAMRLAVRTYKALPEPVRQRLKLAASRV